VTLDPGSIFEKCAPKEVPLGYCTNGAVPFVPSGHFPTPWGITKKLLYLLELMRRFFDKLSPLTKGCLVQKI
ncbi:MAG: hypothetical protein IJ496_07045, partial [Ruminococcus sp.]|nr:hypothetical protein [Ruminococcus sp.]